MFRRCFRSTARVLRTLSEKWVAGWDQVILLVNLLGVFLLVVLANEMLMYSLGVEVELVSDISLAVLSLLICPLAAEQISGDR